MKSEHMISKYNTWNWPYRPVECSSDLVAYIERTVRPNIMKELGEIWENTYE